MAPFVTQNQSAQYASVGKPELAPLDAGPWTPRALAAPDCDWDCDLAVVWQAARFTLKARTSNNIKAFNDLILNHLLHLIPSEGSLFLRSMSMKDCG